MTTYTKKEIQGLIDGKLDWEMVHRMMSSQKDLDRFKKYVEILQERIPWKEKILLPLSEHLYIVQKGEERIVKCDCGHEFGDYRVNWKLSALIYIRDTEETLDEIYPGDRKGEQPLLTEIREYYCPACGSQLEVESLTPGYYILFDFLPDLDTFYDKWLKKPLGGKKEEWFKDKTSTLTRAWIGEKT